MSEILRPAALPIPLPHESKAPRAGRTAADAQRVAEVCRCIEQAVAQAGPMPKVQELAQGAGMSPVQLQRVFKAQTGITPKAYADAQRASKMHTELQRAGQSVTDSLYAAGFNASSRFYEAASKRLGMTPTRYRQGGPDTSICFALAPCSLGHVLVAASSIGLCAIFLGDEPEALLRDLQERFPRAELKAGDADFEQCVSQVLAFIDDPRLGLNLPLDIRGTAFQQRVWQALRQIPPGTTLSYSQLAQSIGAPNAVRAVASACAANALAVAVPCHRVVRNDGQLSGYRWGVERKRALLEKEKP